MTFIYFNIQTILKHYIDYFCKLFTYLLDDACLIHQHLSNDTPFSWNYKEQDIYFSLFYAVKGKIKGILTKKRAKTGKNKLIETACWRRAVKWSFFDVIYLSLNNTNKDIVQETLL